LLRTIPEVISRRVCHIILIVFTCHCVSAQTCCSAGAPINTALDIGTADSKTLSVQLAYEYKSINRLVSEDEILRNDPRSRSGQNVGLKADYVFDDRWAVTGLLPIVQQRRSTQSTTQESIGLGDATVLLQYAPLRSDRLDIMLGAGIKLPTGTTDHQDASSIFLSPDMQSGSGSVDYILRFGLASQQLVHPSLSSNFSVSYKHNGENDGFASTANFPGRRFSFGDEWIARIGFAYQLVTASAFWVPDVALQYRRSEANTEQTTAAPNSGGQWLSIPLGFSYVPNDKISIRSSVELPFYQDLEGLQITTDLTVGFQIKYNFSLSNSIIP